MNIVILQGRLTKDPEVRYTQSRNGTQQAVSRYTLAVDRPRRENGETTTDFINCVTFGKTAEFAEKYLYKGIKITIRGKIQTGSYTNRDGQKIYTTDVVVNEHEFCERRRNNEQQGSNYNNEAVYHDQKNHGNQSHSVYTEGIPSGNNNNGRNERTGGYSPNINSDTNSDQNDFFLGSDPRFMNIPDGIEEELPFN